MASPKGQVGYKQARTIKSPFLQLAQHLKLDSGQIQILNSLFLSTLTTQKITYNKCTTNEDKITTEIKGQDGLLVQGSELRTRALPGVPGR